MQYLDHNATSPLRPEARAAMERALGSANPSSVHAEGRKARALVEEARARVAKLANADPQDVIFTSGGTEANALALHAAIYGSAEAETRLTRIFVSAIEHDSVSANAKALTERFAGLRLETLPVTTDGVLDLDALRIALREGKGRALIAVMAANNETGVIQPIAEIAKLAREAGALLFVDAIQAAGKISLAFDADYLTISSHKLGGPQGAGALIVKPGAPFAPQILGGGQERGHRAGHRECCRHRRFWSRRGSKLQSFRHAARSLRTRAKRNRGLTQSSSANRPNVSPTLRISHCRAPSPKPP